MNRGLLVLIVVASAVLFIAAGGIIRAPGATGMNTDTDAQDLRATDSRMTVNGDVTTYRGVLSKRLGFAEIDTPGFAMSAGAAIYDPLTSWKAAVYVRPQMTLIREGYDEDLSGTWTLVADTMSIGGAVNYDTTLGSFYFTKQYSVDTTNDGAEAGWWTGYRESHDFVATPDGVVHVSKGSPPVLLSLQSVTATSSYFYDTTITLLDTSIDCYETFDRWGEPLDRSDTVCDTTIMGVDTIYDTIFVGIENQIVFAPRITSVSMEAPGTLRVFAVDSNSTAGELSGVFEYATFFLGSKGVYVNNSRGVRVSGGGVILTKFPRDPHSTDDSSYTVICRRAVSTGSTWRIIDTIRYHRSARVVYVDTLTAATTEVGIRVLSFSVAGPTSLMNYGGKIRADGGTGYTLPIAGSWTGDSAYYLAYSFLDTLLNVESPLSPLTVMVVPSPVGGLQPVSSITMGYSGGPQAVRIYRSDALPSAVFYDNRSEWFGKGTSMYDERFSQAATMYAIEDMRVSGWAGYVRINFGKGHDTTIAAGNGPVLSGDGTVISRPDGYNLITGLKYPLKDVEYWNDRLYGIGDPEFPSRLYYSEVGVYGDWPATNWYDMDENDNDILVAIELISVGSQEAMIALKRRKAFIVFAGQPSDVEFNGGALWGAFPAEENVFVTVLSYSIGALNRDLVLRHGDAVYAVTNNMDVVRFRGTRIDTISTPVWSHLREILTDTTTNYGKHYRPGSSASSTNFATSNVLAKMMVMGDEILIVNQAYSSSTIKALAWNTTSQTWSSMEYGFGDAPRGTFKYDTISAPDFAGDAEDVFYFDGEDYPLLTQQDTLSRDYLETSSPAYYDYQMIYRSPEFTTPEMYSMLRSVEFDYSGVGPTITLRAISGDGDTLATSSFAANAGHRKHPIVGFAPHAAKGIMLDLTISADSGNVKIYNLRPDFISVGVPYTE